MQPTIRIGDPKWLERLALALMNNAFVLLFDADGNRVGNRDLPDATWAKVNAIQKRHRAKIDAAAKGMTGPDDPRIKTAARRIVMGARS